MGRHLHQFYIGGKFYDVPYAEPGFTRTIDEREVKLSDLGNKEIKKFQYEYDMGDGWEHELILEKTIEPDKKVSYPVCIDGRRNCPPEDCGGIPGDLPPKNSTTCNWSDSMVKHQTRRYGHEGETVFGGTDHRDYQ
ncbi:MAG: plasmid pRiA4b ORF-3 family protein, partial [Candidatus Omnitrophota bacterium]